MTEPTAEHTDETGTAVVQRPMWPLMPSDVISALYKIGPPIFREAWIGVDADPADPGMAGVSVGDATDCVDHLTARGTAIQAAVHAIGMLGANDMVAGLLLAAEPVRSADTLDALPLPCGCDGCVAQRARTVAALREHPELAGYCIQLACWPSAVAGRVLDVALSAQPLAAAGDGGYL